MTLSRPTLALLLLLSASGTWAVTGAPRGDSSADREVTPRGELRPEELHLTRLFEDASRSVVHITSLRLRRSFTRDVYRVPEGSGSGFVWDEGGHIVTNFHVIQGGETFQVVLADESSWPATLVGAAPHKDLAVLRIDAPRSRLVPLALGGSSDLRVGQSTYAIGNPFGLDQSLTRGVISALGREITSRMQTTIYDVIQSDTAVNPGNSGGPLLDSAGRLIGVNTAIFSPTGATPEVWAAMSAVQKPIIGFSPYPRELPRGFPDGVLVVEVPEGSALERSGLRGTREDRLGDIITAVNGRPTPTREDLEAVLERYRAGERVTLTLVRGAGYDGAGGRSVELQTAESRGTEEQRRAP